MKRIHLLILLFSAISFSHLAAQKQNNQWRFGNNGGIDFNTLPPVFAPGAALQTSEGSASIADRTTGALLFYTDGVTVWNANNQVMPNGTGLQGGDPTLLSSTTAAVIVPKPGSNTLFYIITIDEQASSNGVKYSVVDMTLNGGLGDVVAGQKNIFLCQTNSEKLEVVPTADALGYWLITHDNPGNGFLAFRIDATGIQTAPVTSLIGGTQGNGAGHMKINRQFNKIAMGNLFDATVELFDFNNATGVVSNLTSWNFNYPNAILYGVEFSPNGNVLYVSNLERVIQYDISQPSALAIENSAYEVYSSFSQPASLQLGIDDRIYLTAGSIDVINCPNKLGAACGFQTNAIANQTGGGGYGLPKWIYYLDETVAPTVNAILFSDTCLTNPTAFSIQNTAGISNVDWLFGDPGSGASNTASGFSVAHTFSQVGTFNIRAILTNNCGTDTLFLNALPIINCVQPCEGSIASSDTCITSPVAFSIISAETINSIQWSFGDTLSVSNSDNSINTSHIYSLPGAYSVQAIVNFACGVDTLFKTISLSSCEKTNEDCSLYMANSFSPNDDGINDTYFPKSICATEHFELVIFNRWGEIVYSSTNPLETWDGKSNGIACFDGVYAYVIKYKFPSQSAENAYGIITLLR